MDRPTKQDKKKSDDSFLSRWSARKTQIAKGELVPDEKPTPIEKEVNEGGGRIMAKRPNCLIKNC